MTTFQPEEDPRALYARQLAEHTRRQWNSFQTHQRAHGIRPLASLPGSGKKRLCQNQDNINNNSNVVQLTGDGTFNYHAQVVAMSADRGRSLAREVVGGRSGQDETRPAQVPRRVSEREKNHSERHGSEDEADDDVSGAERSTSVRRPGRGLYVVDFAKRMWNSNGNSSLGRPKPKE